MSSNPHRLAAVLTIVVAALVGLHAGLPATAVADGGMTDNGGSDPPCPPGGIQLPSGPSGLLDVVAHLIPRVVRLAMI